MVQLHQQLTSNINICNNPSVPHPINAAIDEIPINKNVEEIEENEDVFEFFKNKLNLFSSETEEEDEESLTTKHAYETKEYENENISYIRTLSSPFKVTQADNNIVATTSQSSQNNRALNNNYDILEKVSRNILSMKYEIRSLHEKIDKLEELIINNTVNNSTELNKNAISIETDSFQSMIHNAFPLKDEDALQVFENKILDSAVRVLMVNELSRNVCNTLQSTVRSIMRYLFTDSLLQEYSYKGQKKKKVFSTLGVCSIIFDAIKHMKRSQIQIKLMLNSLLKFLLLVPSSEESQPHIKNILLLVKSK